MTEAQIPRPLRALLVNGRRQMRRALASPARLMSDEDRERIEGEIHEGGQLSSSYALLLFAACGIAALGLLQSSVAVVIGAMLISPLMGPILSMGLALARVEPRDFRRAALTLAAGALLSVLASTLIVWASPLKDVTPEILARTRPTLLDLIVALLSGFVGAYLTINRKGGSIAGVAIATALMPPLAVIGYGLATQAWAVAAGASLLFLTNVVAILGSVFGVARRYGFAPVARRGAAWEAPALFAATALLCVPLALSLRGIVEEARENTRVRSAIEQAFSGAEPHITELSVETRRGAAASVQCVVVTRRFVPQAAAAIAKRLNPGAIVSVEQVVTANGVPAADPAGGSLGNRQSATLAQGLLRPEQRLQAMLAASGQVLAIRRTAGGYSARLILKGEPNLADYQALEQAAQQFFPENQVEIVPPVLPMPDVVFARGSTRLDDRANASIATTAWALRRWAVDSVLVEGDASPGRRGRRPVDVRIAGARANAVGEGLRALGVTRIETTAVVPERLEGEEERYLVAHIRIRPAPPPTSPPAPNAP